MPELILLVTQGASLNLPTSLAGWIGWLVLLVITLSLNFKWKSYNQLWDNWHKWAIILLGVSIPITALFLPGIQFELGNSEISLPLFGAVPWFLAAGLIGPGVAAGIAFFSGLIISIWGGMSIFHPLELAFLATCIGWMFFQDFRTLFFRTIRHPLVASIIISFVYPLIYMISTIFIGQGSVGMRVASGIDGVLIVTLANGISFVLAGVVSEITANLLKPNWGAQHSVRPSPAERKLATRLMISIIPLALLLLVILVVSAWSIAGRAARQMLKGQMVTAAEMTAENIPFYLETGQNLLLRLANEPLYEKSADEIWDELVVQRREIPYFDQLLYLDPQGNLITSDPREAFITPPISNQEYSRIQAAQIVPLDITSISPEQESNSAILSFIAGVKDQNGELLGVLIGRSDLEINPFSKPLITSLQSLTEIEGQGLLIDENDVIIYHQLPSKVGSRYEGNHSATAEFFDERSEDGSGELVYYHPIAGKPWSVIIQVPANYIQQQAASIALPMLIIIMVLVLIAVLLLHFGLKSVTRSLEDLSFQANLIAQGDLDKPIEVSDVDEIGQLRYAFEQMRKSLKSRLDELNRVVFVSEGIASTINIEESLERVLESALDFGATSARAYLLPSVIPSKKSEISAFKMGVGVAGESYAHLDEQVSMLSEKQPILRLNNLTRPKIFTNVESENAPQAILAVALKNENRYFGTLWVAFDRPHKFTDEEIRYISMLAGQATLATENARLFLTSEIGRQRLESVLNSTPDPVLVTDEEDNLLVINTAAREVFNLYEDIELRKPASEVITNTEVLELLQEKGEEVRSKEVTMRNGRAYYASSSKIAVGDLGAGSVCVLRDITSLKELNASKADFVSTVSHDLRSPLALIQGYTSMLKMVGELNEQQSGFLKKISDETEKMSHLVTNLLDLGRIEAEIGLNLEKKTVDDVIERVISASQVQADQNRITLIANIDQANLPTIEADQALLQQALFNIVDNAIKFSEPGGEVRVSLDIKDDGVVYIVEDNGIGISPADQQNLFNKFSQTTNKEGFAVGGSGLGLAIANTIAEKHSGRIRVESKLGVGSTFYLELPLQQAYASNRLK